MIIIIILRGQNNERIAKIKYIRNQILSVPMKLNQELTYKDKKNLTNVLIMIIL